MNKIVGHAIVLCFFAVVMVAVARILLCKRALQLLQCEQMELNGRSVMRARVLYFGIFAVRIAYIRFKLMIL